jgi:hypothetical protein
MRNEERLGGVYTNEGLRTRKAVLRGLFNTETQREGTSTRGIELKPRQ